MRTLENRKPTSAPYAKRSVSAREMSLKLPTEDTGGQHNFITAFRATSSGECRQKEEMRPDTEGNGSQDNFLGVRAEISS